MSAAWIPCDPEDGLWRIFGGKQEHSRVAQWAHAAGARETHMFDAKTSAHKPSSIPQVLSTSPDTTTVYIMRDAALGFGLKFGGPANQHEVETLGAGIFIKEVRPGTPAASVDALEVGLQIVRLNGMNLEQASFSELHEAVQRDSMKMELVVRPNLSLYRAYNPGGRTVRKTSFSQVFPDSAAATPSSLSATIQEDGDQDQVIQASVTRDENGFGIRFGGARHAEDARVNGSGIFVAGVNHGSAAERTPNLKAGMQIIRINGIDIRKGHFEDLRDHLVAAGSTLQLEMIKNDQLFRTYAEVQQREGGMVRTRRSLSDQSDTREDQLAENDLITTTLVQNESGYGINFVGANDENDAVTKGWGVYISGTKPGSVAAADPLIKSGQQIISINGTDLRQGTIALLKTVLSEAGSSITLVLKPQNDRITTTLTKGHSGFGLKFGGALNDDQAQARGMGGIFVASIKPGTAAAENSDIRIGWRIESINGQNLHDATFETLKAVLRTAGDTVTLELYKDKALAAAYNQTVPSADSSSPGPHTTAGSTGNEVEAIEVNLSKGSTGYGLKFGGAIDTADGERHGYGIYISGIIPDTVAATHDRIRRGLQVLKMNGMDLSGGTYEQVREALRRENNNTMSLTLRENSELADIYDSLKSKALKAPSKELTAKRSSLHASSIKVTLNRGSDGFGLKFGGARDAQDAEFNEPGIYISGTKPGTVAEATPAIRVGLQVKKLNGVPLNSFDDLKRVLGESTDQLVLELQKNDALVEKYQTVSSKTARPSMHMPLSGSSDVDVVSVTLYRDESGFGLKFGGARNRSDAHANGPGIFLSGTKPGSVADRNPDVRAGQQILKMNGVDLSQATFDELKDVLGKADSALSLELKDNPELASAYTSVKSREGRASLHFVGDKSTGPVRTELSRGPAGFGMVFEGAHDYAHGTKTMFGIFIKEIKPNTSADLNPQIQEGMQLLSINGANLRQGTFEDLKRCLSIAQQGKPLIIELDHNPELLAAHSESTS